MTLISRYAWYLEYSKICENIHWDGRICKKKIDNAWLLDRNVQNWWKRMKDKLADARTGEARENCMVVRMLKQKRNSFK